MAPTKPVMSVSGIRGRDARSRSSAISRLTAASVVHGAVL